MNRHLRILAGADFLSVSAGQLLGLALCELLVLGRHQGERNLLFLLAAAQTPAFLLSFVSGGLLDRSNPARILFVCGAAKALPALLLSLVPGSHVVVFLIYAFHSAADLLHISARSTLVPFLFPPEDIMHANAFRQKAALTGGILGPICMGWIVSQAGPVKALILCAFLCFISGVPGVLLMKPSEMSRRRLVRESPPPSATARNLPVLQWLLLLFMSAGAGGLFQYASPLWIDGRSWGNAAALGAVFSLFNAGSFAGAILVSRMGCMSRVPMLRLGMISEGAGILALAAPLCSLPPFLGIFMFLGVTSVSRHILIESRIQALAPPMFMGRTMSAAYGLRALATVSGAGLGFLVFSRFGINALLLACGFFLFLGALCNPPSPASLKEGFKPFSRAPLRRGAAVSPPIPAEQKAPSCKERPNLSD